MKKIILFFIIISATTLFSNEYAIVANPNINKLSLGEIRAIYLQKIIFFNNLKMVPLNLSPKNRIRKSFEKKVLKMNINRLKSYWIKQHYLGHRPPITMKSQKSLQKFITNVDGAIGYVEIKNLQNGMNILYKWSD